MFNVISLLKKIKIYFVVSDSLFDHASQRRTSNSVTDFSVLSNPADAQEVKLYGNLWYLPKCICLIWAENFQLSVVNNNVIY